MKRGTSSGHFESNFRPLGADVAPAGAVLVHLRVAVNASTLVAPNQADGVPTRYFERPSK
jgi:hypothetical protein